MNLDITVRSDGKTCADKNGDFKFNDGQEMRAAYDLAAAVTKRNASAVEPEEEARVVVLADSDCLTDLALRLNQGNRALVLDVMRWLGGEERFSGQVSSEEDMPSPTPARRTYSGSTCRSSRCRRLCSASATC